MKLEVLKHPHPILAGRASEVVPAQMRHPATTALVMDMFETMRAENGMGLAAPQVGMSARIFIMDKCPDGLVVINPEIVSQSERETAWTEECLSVPNRRVSVRRPKWIVATWRDLDWKVHLTRLSHLDARCFLHELDHLDGKTIADQS